jgi:Spy/CpxP family protein refolding chaperone
MHDRHNPERAQEHAQRMASHLARAVDATEEQKLKLTAIAQTIAKEIGPVHEKMQAAHKKAHALLLQPTTDRTALEALRVEQIALADDVSKKLTQALADAADVLTPEQRTKLAQRWDN